VNVRAKITLRNPPKGIESRFEVTQTVTVIPKALSSCNARIVRPNDTLDLAAQFNAEVGSGVDGLEKAHYRMAHELSGQAFRDGWVFVRDSKLVVKRDAPSGEHVSVTLVLQSPRAEGEEAHKTKARRQFPLAQAASLIVSIVQPTGLSLVEMEVLTENAMFAQSVSASGNAEQPFWAQPKIPQSVDFGATENVLCERQKVRVRVAILEELARELHGEAWQCRVESNDTSIVAPHKCVAVQQGDVAGGPMYAQVVLEAKLPGFATLTFREQDVSRSEDVMKAEQTSAAAAEMYVFDDPQFLRTFATIRVVDESECLRHFGVRFVDEATGANETLRANVKAAGASQWEDGAGMSFEGLVMSVGAMGYWTRLMCAVAGVLFVLYMIWPSGVGRVVGGGAGRGVDDDVNPAAFNPLQNLNLSQNNPYLDLSGVNHSNLSFNM